MMEPPDFSHLRQFTHFPYSLMEASLARSFGFYPDKTSLLRSKLKNFQKLSIATRKPGKGQKVLYSIRDFFYWGFVLELTEIGLAPATIGQIMTFYIDVVLDGMRDIKKSDGNMLYVAFEASLIDYSLYGMSPKYLGKFQICNQDELCKLVCENKTDRLILINLSRLRSRLHNSMSAAFSEKTGMELEEYLPVRSTLSLE